MPQEIHLSLIGPNAEKVRPFLEEFERQEGIHVDLTILGWENAWNHLVKASIYAHDLDVSEIGSTWVGDMVRMDILRPFEEREIAFVGGQSAFISAFWDGGHVDGNNRLMAMPWLTGSRLLYYRRSLFAKAGVDPEVAFSSVDAFSESLRKLQEAGISAPWLVTTVSHDDTMLNIGSWIWGKGGELMAADGKSTMFARPEALSGIISYFELSRFLPSRHYNIPAIDINYHFLDDPDCATFVSGVWLYQWAKDRLSPEEFEDIGIAHPPSASFVGGSYLAIWKHSMQVSAGIKLINFLTQTHTAVNFGNQAGLLPARVASLTHPAFAGPMWQASIAGLQTGRTFPSVELWGLVQNRLIQEFGEIWKEVLSHPEKEVSEIVTPRIQALARRLDITLMS